MAAAGRVTALRWGEQMADKQNNRRTGRNDGIRAVAPLLLAVIPFGLVLGVTAAGSAVGGALGIGTSFIIFAGAAQLVTVQLIDSGTSLLVVVSARLTWLAL